MKPYRWGGRFYNNKHDSILVRFKNFVKSFCFVTGHHARKIFVRKKQGKVNSVASWMVRLDTPVERSHEPLITWLGHSTFLIQFAGLNIITDPMFFGGFPVFTRQLGFPISMANLPKIDVVIVSHNHKDHMDMRSLRVLKAHDPCFLVPAGNKKWFARRGFKNVIEKTWWESEHIGPMTLSFLPAIHWTSRGLLDINKTLWGSWMLEAAGYKIYFAGDTAYGDHFSAIAQRYSQIDVALMPIGPNEPRSYIAEAHVSTEEAIKAFIDLGARQFVPMHWGTFIRMGAERYDDPIGHLTEIWERYQDQLSNSMLHVVRCGEPLKLR